MSKTTHGGDDFDDLRLHARLSALRLKVARQNEALSALRREGSNRARQGAPAELWDRLAR